MELLVKAFGSHKQPHTNRTPECAYASKDEESETEAAGPMAREWVIVTDFRVPVLPLRFLIIQVSGNPNRQDVCPNRACDTNGVEKGSEMAQAEDLRRNCWHERPLRAVTDTQNDRARIQ